MLAALLGGVAGPVRRDRVARCGARPIVSRATRYTSSLAAAPAEADHAQVAGHQPGDHRGRLGQRRGALALASSSSVVFHNATRAPAGRAVVVDDPQVEPTSSAHHLGRIRHVAEASRNCGEQP